MQRHELVADTVKKCSVEIDIEPMTKKWTTVEQLGVIKDSRVALDRVNELDVNIRILVKQNYPVEVVTYVQPVIPGSQQIASAPMESEDGISVTFSPALLGAVAEWKSCPFGEVANTDILNALSLVAGYLVLKLVYEEKWNSYLCEEV